MTSAAVKSRARELGFDLCGVAPAARHPRLQRLSAWLDRGRAGDMQYLADSRDERLDPAAVLQSARTVVSLAVVYNTGQPYSTAVDDPSRVAVARYAWGEDYHGVLRARLRALLAWMAESAGPGFEGFSCVDDGPVQERVFAEQAGLGWIGKNTCVINPRLGSWLFLCEVICNADLEVDVPAVDQCGTCTRCLEACPTGAIVEPYEVDATRCLSYLTIERRAPIEPALRGAVERQIAGCDICQDVCPWNRRAAVSDDPAWQPREIFRFPRLLDLCRLTDDAWSQALKGSALRRAGLRRLRRSLALAAAHAPAGTRAAAIAALETQPSARHPDVADAIDWATREGV